MWMNYEGRRFVDPPLVGSYDTLLLVDRICRDTVKQWRFRPFKVDGKARKTCSTVTFDIRFD